MLQYGFAFGYNICQAKCHGFGYIGKSLAGRRSLTELEL
jgi:hypothetical protein